MGTILKRIPVSHKMDEVLITGGSGFIGSHICKELLKKGYNVVCFDNLSTGDYKNIKELQGPNFQFVKGDVNNMRDLGKVFAKPIGYIVHLAAVVGVKRTNKYPLVVFRDMVGLKNICKQAREHGVKKVVYASSSEVYGDRKELMREDDPVVIDKPYSAVKITGEQYMEVLRDKFGVSTCSLRLFNVYGEKQLSSSYGFVTGIFITQALSRVGPSVFGSGSNTRDFTHISDTTNAFVAALEKEEAVGVINVGTGVRTTIKDLAEKIVQKTHPKLELRHLEPLENDVQHRCADVTKMKELLGVTPRISLDKGLEETIEWYREHA
jgi:nucleoside-diphosphate-sugar epimerase